VQQLEEIALREINALAAELMAELGISVEYLKLGVQDDQAHARLPEKRQHGLHGGIGWTRRVAGVTSWPAADFALNGIIDAFSEKIQANHVTPTMGRWSSEYD
jgi:hypothetical protein